MVTEALSYLGAEVRRIDWDRFICALFAPAPRREALFAVLAFNAEIAKTRDLVSEAALGEMRLQWWRDAVAKVYDAPDTLPEGNPVLEEFAKAVRSHHLPRAIVDAMIDARSMDLEDTPFENVEELLAYARASSAGLTELILYVLGAYDGSDPEAEQIIRRAGGQLGTAWAVIGLIRATDALLAQGRTYMPHTLLAEAGITPQQAVTGGASPQTLKDAVQLLAGIAAQYLYECRQARPAIPKSCLPAFLPAVLAGAYLHRLRRAGYDPSGGRIERGRFSAQAKVMMLAMLGRY
ncbi:MAG: squalene/phytoene synthase family protein [Rhodospirillales bacterium]|nr:squalene/phytoene synthase family protein [Rhodospirillales bacterium]